MKKFVSAAAVAAVFVGLAGVMPAQAAPVTCAGVTATKVVNAKGADDVFGTDGKDVIVVNGTYKSVAYITIYAGNGNDLICNQSATPLLVFGGAGNDDFRGNATPNIFLGGLGDDNARGGDGNESLFGGAGNDVLDGLGGNDLVAGHAGNDRLFGGNGTDNVIGGSGTDIVSGQSFGTQDDKAADRLYGDSKEMYTMKGDITYIKADALTAFNKATRAAIAKKYADKSQFWLTKGGQVIDGETYSEANIIGAYVNDARSMPLAFWVAG